MTLHISDDQAMDAVVASRPETDAIDNAWYVGRREQVLRRVLATPHVNQPAAPARPPRATRWGLVAAAAALLAAGGLFAQVLAPIGNPGSPQAAQALDRLAVAVPATPVIPNGSYELTVYEDAGIAESDNGPDAYATTRSTWLGCISASAFLARRIGKGQFRPRASTSFSKSILCPQFLGVWSKAPF